MPESKSKLLVPAISTAIVVAGGIAAYVYFKSTLGDTSGPINSAKVVPANALIAAYVNTDPQSWNKLKQFGTVQARQVLAKGLQDVNKELFKELFNDTNISYEADIKPWINGVMIAELPPTLTTPAREQSNTLLVVGIKDKLRALNFANKLQQQKGTQMEESDYKGQKIIASKNQSLAILNNTHILLASEKQTVEKAIDTYKGGPSFASKEGASSILAKSVDVENSLGQIYMPDYANTAEKLMALSADSPALDPRNLAQLKQIKSLVAGVGVDDTGLRLKVVMNLDPQLSKFEYQTTPANIVKELPSDTFALVTGQNINSIWQTFLKQSQDYPEVKQTVEQTRRQMKQEVNLDLDKDIFSWMNGEFALGAVKPNQGVSSSIGFGGAMVFDTSDRKTAETTFTKLDDLAKKQLLNVVQRNISGKKITEWQIPAQGALLSHGWLDQDTVFVALGESVGEKLADKKGQTLNNSDTFKTVIGSLAKPNSGYFYLDMDNTTSLIAGFSAPNLGQPLPPDVSSILGSIRGIGITSNSPNKSTIQVEMLLALKPSSSK
jgi:hypothetical protein